MLSICTSESSCVTRLEPQPFPPAPPANITIFARQQRPHSTKVAGPVFLGFLPGAEFPRLSLIPRPPTSSRLATFFGSRRPYPKRLVNTFILFINLVRPRSV